MKEIILSLDHLGLAIEDKGFINEENKFEYLYTNICYKFKKEGVNFSCELYIDNNELIHVTKINGEESEGSVLTIDTKSGADIKNAYNFFAIFYNFLPTSNLLEIFSTASIEINEIKYECLCIEKERLYFLGLSEKSTKDIEDFDFPYYDNVKIIPISDITYISLDYHEISHYLCIATKDNVCNVHSKYLYEEQAEDLITLKNKINISLINNRAAN